MRDATCNVPLSHTYHEQLAYIMMWMLEKGPFSTQARVDWAIKKRFHSRAFFSSLFHQYLLFGLQLYIFFFNLQLRKQDVAEVRKVRTCLSLGKSIFPDLIPLPLLCVVVSAPYFYASIENRFSAVPAMCCNMSASSIHLACVFFFASLFLFFLFQ